MPGAPSSAPRAPRRRLRWTLVGIAVFALALAAARLSHTFYDEPDTVVVVETPGPVAPTWVADGSAQLSNPFAGKQLYVWPRSPAAGAATSATAVPGSARTRRVLERLASVPTGVWLVPERNPLGSIGTFVQEIVREAEQGGRVPVFVLYGIPQRDCTGLESAGGLDEGQYLDWVREFTAAAGPGSVVVLEPDAIASATECGLREQRERILSAALDILTPGPATYVEAGHSNWRDPQEMADILRAIRVDRARGIAVNVSAYQPEEDERRYAEQILDSLGGGAYVVDTGRNGAGATGEWCNPEGRAFGPEPQAVDDGSRLDARLWIKPPGESDGTCGGGPPAGQYWVERALQMAAVSGW
ncbi:glycoside hydrolase family 6 protein [Nocardioides sp. zg-536]|uniref:Glucanase n=1 Tax=Nocardioides faecalis TaxID=2803858 RepID=A0A938Y3Y3_9ACTN|nr:glycoside hydrolase family 6 protein [Nocardioides faecalis]MBM9461431.1 glycoside hydrolase family 6 protein [Nocardioides faecalis]MBS4751759.1 glycoside hydrolase family 6 protein [Nocardioides faecalis]QVI59379.1 glycoside hydrolase family 6 protein [Nocardioides faecalis]